MVDDAMPGSRKEGDFLVRSSDFVEDEFGALRINRWILVGLNHKRRPQNLPETPLRDIHQGHEFFDTGQGIF